jgi:hypothetical protein
MASTEASTRVTTVQRGYHAFQTGDMDPLRALLASDVAWHAPRSRLAIGRLSRHQRRHRRVRPVVPGKRRYLPRRGERDPGRRPKHRRLGPLKRHPWQQDAGSTLRAHLPLPRRPSIGGVGHQLRPSRDGRLLGIADLVRNEPHCHFCADCQTRFAGRAIRGLTSEHTHTTTHVHWRRGRGELSAGCVGLDLHSWPARRARRGRDCAGAPVGSYEESDLHHFSPAALCCGAGLDVPCKVTRSQSHTSGGTRR